MDAGATTLLLDRLPVQKGVERAEEMTCDASFIYTINNTFHRPTVGVNSKKSNNTHGEKNIPTRRETKGEIQKSTNNTLQSYLVLIHN